MDERGRARGRIAAWPAGIAAARARVLGSPWAQRALGGHAADVIAGWAVAETAPGRLMPWLPVAFGLGIVLYFTAEREPALWAVVPTALVLAGAVFLARNRPLAFPLLLALACVGAGFAVATARTAIVAHPVLDFPAWNVAVTGWVEVREERERSDRITIRVHSIDARRLDIKPDRVRVSVRKGTAPAVGSFVSLKARLTPPLAPLRPGGYDFARDMYFQGIGASGFVLGKITVAAPPQLPGSWLRYKAAIARIRDAIDDRIRAVVAGDEGSIASALITGKRDAITTPVNDAMYISSLAHVLSISGYHMAVVAGVVFFIIRALLALVPALANRHPIKKWAAGAALIAAAFYLLLSGAEVATQRSFIMIGIVLAAVMLDRQALTFRTITVAAFTVLLLAPESAVQPSFQMSFAATLALIAAYRHGLPWATAGADTSLGARAALWGVREIVGLVLASLVAGLATTPYAAYHFHRLAPYGVLANLLAMPVVSAWVMPTGILGVLAMPFGFDAPLWRAMGEGIDWMIAVALWVAHLPGAVGRIAAFGTGPLLLGTAGLIALCLLRTPLRWSGAVFAVIASAWALAVPRPDILVAADGRAVALRTTGGHLSAARSGSDAFAIREWLAADGDSRLPNDPTLHDGVACDEAGCIGRLADGRLVALDLTMEAFAEDCQRASVLVTAREAPPRCRTLVVDRTRWRQTGALALYRAGDRFVTEAARPPGYDRPWSRPFGAARAEAAARRPTLRPRDRTPDATPRAKDLQAGD